jgi:hypothetical protein
MPGQERALTARPSPRERYSLEAHLPAGRQGGYGEIEVLYRESGDADSR